MLFSGKENVFMCLVAFQKIFRKIFSGVWKRRRKRQSQQNMDKTQKKPRQKIINDRRSTGFDGAVLRELQSDDRAVDRAVVGLDGAISRRREDRDWRHEIAIDGAISWSINHDLAKHRADSDRRSASRDRDLGLRSSNWSSRDRRGLELGVRQRSSGWSGARSSTITRSLSLSLSFSGNTLKWKWKCKMISVVKAFFFRSTEINFRKILFSGPTKHPHFRKSISGSDFHPKQT